jgi:hypothetical protein
MKLWLIALPLLFGAAFAQAEDAISPAMKPSAASADIAKPLPIKKVHKHKMKRMQATDRRHCLELKTNLEIIRCAEQRK